MAMEIGKVGIKLSVYGQRSALGRLVQYLAGSGLNKLVAELRRARGNEQAEKEISRALDQLNSKAYARVVDAAPFVTQFAKAEAPRAGSVSGDPQSANVEVAHDFFERGRVLGGEATTVVNVGSEEK